MSDSVIVKSRAQSSKGRSKRRRSSRNKTSSLGVVAGFVAKLLGLVVLLITLNVFRDFPTFGYGLIGVGIAYFFVLFFIPRLWLIVLPLAMVCLDLATYTGRFLFNEYDLLFLVTIAFGLLSGKFSLSGIKPGWPIWLIGSYCIVVLSGFSAWNVFIAPPEAIDSNPYYLPEYGYKVIKGMLWALMLVPIWFNLLQQDRHKTLSWLVFGQCITAFMLVFVILWERGTLGVILSGGPWYHIVSSLLDLSSSYRTTGIFSDMHTGGEVVDGVILLLLPTVLYGISQGASHTLRVLSLIAFASLAYCTMVGFTRATYVSFFMGIVTFVVLYILSHRREGTLMKGVPYGLLAMTAVVVFPAAYFSFSLAGSYGVASFSVLMISAYAGGQLFRRNHWLAIGFWGAVGFGCLSLAISAHFDSRWVDRSGESAFVLAGLLLFVYLITSFLFVRVVKQPEFNKLLLVALLVMMPAGFSIAFGGYKFNERMENVSKDMETRIAHWERVVQSSDSGLLTSIFGNGVGSFPANYVYRFPDAVREIGSYVVNQSDQGAYLRMGPGEDLAFGQRVSVRPDTVYKLRVKIRAEGRGKIVAFLCERNLIFASNFMANCNTSTIRFNEVGGGFIEYSGELSSGQVGRRHWLFRWPTTLYLKNFSKDALVDIEDVYFGVQGTQLLKNSMFSNGTDDWFFYNDFAHLPWHIKNTYLQSWYNYGWFGLALFLAMAAATVMVAVKRQGNIALPVAFASGIVAIGVFGVFGSPLDSSRVSWLFYFYMFASLMWPQELRNKEELSNTQEVGNKSKELSSKDSTGQSSDIDGVVEPQ